MPPPATSSTLHGLPARSAGRRGGHLQRVAGPVTRSIAGATRTCNVTACRSCWRWPAAGRPASSPASSACTRTSCRSRHGGPHGHISDLYVAPAYRGTGVAQSLLQAMIDRLAGPGCATRADRGAQRQRGGDQGLSPLRLSAVLDRHGSGSGLSRCHAGGCADRLVDDRPAAAPAAHVASPTMLADGEAAVGAAGDHAGLRRRSSEWQRRALHPIARACGLPDRIVMVPPADQRMRDLVQQRVRESRHGPPRREADRHEIVPTAEMAGAAPPFGVIEREAPSPRPCRASSKRARAAIAGMWPPSGSAPSRLSSAHDTRKAPQPLTATAAVGHARRPPCRSPARGDGES